MKTTIEHLQEEVKILTEARDGIVKAIKLIKKETNTDDQHLKDLYISWDNKIKDYTRSIGVLQEADNQTNVKG